MVLSDKKCLLFIIQSSVPESDPDPLGSALILLSPLRIRPGNTDPDLEAMSLAKN
jgi:hypothetical protein